MFRRLLLASALFAAASAGAQTVPAGESLAASVGAVLGKFTAISAAPSAAFATCGPQIGNMIGGVRDAAGARAAAAQLRPCIDGLRAAYRQSAEALEKFGAIPTEIQTAAPVDLQRLIDEQRQQFISAIAYMDDLDAFLVKMAANDRPGAMRLFPRLRSGGAALVDGSIIQMRAAQAIARFGSTRGALGLRIVAAEAGKLPLTTAVGPAGFQAGEQMRALAPRASAAAAAVRSGWEQDKAALRALAGGGRAMEPLIEGATPMIQRIAASGDEMAAAMQRAAGRQVVPLADMVALLNELNRHELIIAKAIQDFAQTLQTIGK